MWQKIALATAAVLPLVGCASGATGSAAQPMGQAPVPVVAVQSGQSNMFGAAARDYVLLSIDGQRLPYAPTVARNVALAPAEVVSGTLTLQPNGAFSIATFYRDTKPQKNDGGFDIKYSGICAPEGDAYRMFWEGGGDTQLAISGDTVTVNNSGVLFRYVSRR
jgi:hypothetical protein